MSILIDINTRVLVQGITGHEGTRAVGEMLRYGTRVLAGVTPGKGGQSVEGVPVFNTIAEAQKKFPGINASLICVPSVHVKSAAREALKSGLELINILAENVPVADTAWIIAEAKDLNAKLVGPSSVGIISPGVGKIGSIGGGIDRVGGDIFKKGNVGVVSKSGGMTSEISAAISRAGLGISTALGIGGDQLIGFTFSDALEEFASDRATKAIVMFGEIGGTYEENAAEYILREKFSKPTIALIAGKFTESLPQGTVLGHAGAIVARGRGSYTSKVESLRSSGVLIAEAIDDIPKILKKVL